MNIERLLNIGNSYLYTPLILVGVLLVIYFIRKKLDKSGLITIVNNKTKKQKLVNILFDELNTQEISLYNLVADMDVLGKFNILHAEALKHSAKRSQQVCQYLDLLEDSYLRNSISSFIENVLILAQEIKDIEDTEYNTKLEYQHIAEQAKIHYYYNYQDDEDFMAQLNTEQARVKELVDYYATSKEHLYHRVNILIKEKKSMVQDIEQYKKRTLETKKFYIKYLSFA